MSRSHRPRDATSGLQDLVIGACSPERLSRTAGAALRQVARPHCYSGILVTRHNPSRYTLALGDTVPYGETGEQILS